MPRLIGNHPRKARFRTAAARVAAAPPNMVITPEWRCVFADDFETSHFDENRWWTRYTHNGGYLDYLNDEEQRYREDHNHIQGASSTVQLTAYPKNSEGFYPSGLLRSRDVYPIANGMEWYFECLGQVPNFIGEWPAFWLGSSESIPGDDASAMWPPEIDMMELPNNGVEDTLSMLHCGCQVLDWNTNPQQYWIRWARPDTKPEWGVWWAPFYFNEAMHSWGLWYRRPEFVLYCDREPVFAGQYDWVYDDGRTCPGAYILCNLAVGGSWAGRHGVALDTPQAFVVDYIKVWQRMPQSTIGHELVERRD